MKRVDWHWPHYAIEAWGLGTFMFVAGSVAVALNALPPTSAAFVSLHPIAGRAFFGIAMGLTNAAIVYSMWGARSGAHLNPAFTLTFAWLGKLKPADAAAYAIAQFAGGALGFWLAAVLFGRLLLAPPVSAIVTKPGPGGPLHAVLAETAMTFVLMTVVLVVSNAGPNVARFTGIAASALVALYITFEAPISGMSMNPARTLASAVQGHDFTAIWVYFVGPPLGMLAAAVAYVKIRGAHAVRCGRLNHAGPFPCIFNCSFCKAQSARQ
jgi:aquaporin Z